MRNLKHTNWTVTTDDTNTSSSSVKRFNEELAANANGGFKFGSHLYVVKDIFHYSVELKS